MKILAFAEQRDGAFKQSAFEVTKAASDAAGPLNADVVGLLIGSGIGAIASQLGGFGASRVVVVDDPQLTHYSTTAYAKIVAEVARKEQATILFLPASQMGRDLAPRVAVKLEAGVAADCTALRVDKGEIITSRPVYAGKALTDVRVTSPTSIFKLRPNVFTAGSTNGTSAVVEKVTVTLTADDFGARVTKTALATGRPDVTEAAIIVSGGRGMKGAEHFHLVEELADAFGAAVGASRAVVDAGWRPHDEQVGQTGKTVSPMLYVACGISGAVQHLAGMSTAKYIVAINKDKDAPIFQIADYGIVGDVFEVLPVLTGEVKKLLGKN